MTIAIIGCNTPIGLQLAEEIDDSWHPMYSHGPQRIKTDVRITRFYIVYDANETAVSYIEFLTFYASTEIIFIYQDPLGCAEVIDFIKQNRSNYLLVRLPMLVFGLGQPLIIQSGYAEQHSIYYVGDLADDILHLDCSGMEMALGSAPISFADLTSFEEVEEHKAIKNKFAIYMTLAEQISKVPKDLLITDAIWDRKINHLALALCSKYGFKKIEVDLTKHADWFKTSANSVSKLVKNDYGVRFCALGSIYFDRLENLFTNNSEFINHMIRVLQYAKLMNIRTLVFNNAFNRYMPICLGLQEAHIKFIETMQAIGVYAKQYGITICIEALSRQQGCNYINDNDVLGELIAAINLPHIKAIHRENASQELDPDHIGYSYAYSIATPRVAQVPTCITCNQFHNSINSLSQKLRFLLSQVEEQE